FSGVASAGYYTLARTMLSLPVALVGKAVGDVLYPRFSEYVNSKESIYSLIRNYTLGLFLLTAIPFLAISVFGKTLFVWVFGQNWIIAGVYAQILSPWIMMMLVSRPAIAAIPVLRIQGWY